jgi:hypothetical protein
VQTRNELDRQLYEGCTTVVIGTEVDDDGDDDDANGCLEK